LRTTAVPTGVLESPKELVVLRAEGRAPEQHLKHGILQVVVAGDHAVEPEVFQLAVGEGLK
jgi:hypothetical protein